jgi:hypothetical protein
MDSPTLVTECGSQLVSTSAFYFPGLGFRNLVLKLAILTRIFHGVFSFRQINGKAPGNGVA